MKRLTLFFAVVTLIFIASCKEENPPCIPGHGGNIDLIISPQHHGEPIAGATVYIEFNKQSNPGALSNYDLIKTAEAGNEHIYVSDMGCGDYFIYCVGYDITDSVVVRGGIPYRVSEDKVGTLEILVPVTE